MVATTTSSSMRVKAGRRRLRRKKGLGNIQNLKLAILQILRRSISTSDESCRTARRCQRATSTGSRKYLPASNLRQLVPVEMRQGGGESLALIFELARLRYLDQVAAYVAVEISPSLNGQFDLGQSGSRQRSVLANQWLQKLLHARIVGDQNDPADPVLELRQEFAQLFGIGLIQLAAKTGFAAIAAVLNDMVGRFAAPPGR